MINSNRTSESKYDLKTIDSFPSLPVNTPIFIDFGNGSGLVSRFKGYCEILNIVFHLPDGYTTLRTDLASKVYELIETT